MSIDGKDRSFPRSVRQRKVLDVAAENPDASIEELASMVASASPDLVERVLEEHGDPAADDEEPAESAASEASPTAAGNGPAGTETGTTGDEGVEQTDDNLNMAATDESGTDDAGDEPDAETDLSPDDLSAKQRAVLEIVAADPSATQGEIGDHLGVSAATVSNRVNSIEGFDWSEREAFVTDLFEETPSPEVLRDGGAASETETTDTDTMDSAQSSTTAEEPAATDRTADIEATLDRLEERMTDLEETLEQMAADGESFVDDPELVHKMVHACMESDAIDESEELRILKALLD